jgi:putative NIF3 family GTP cyclohydrolase 1 type 2
MAERVKQAFDVSCLRIVGDLDRQVQKVAVLGGSGSRFVSAARCSGADVFITGDIDYHTALDALADGMALIDPGHNAEKIMKKRVAEYLRAELAAKRYDTRVSASEVDTDPFRFM